MVTFSDQPTIPRIWNKRLIQGGQQTRLQAIAPFLIIFGAHMNILIIIEVKFRMCIEWSYRSPQLCSLLSLK